MTPSPRRSFEVRVPASTANLGAGFDCLGLALELFLKVRATVLSKPGARTLARTSGVRGSSELPSAPEQNLILRAMRHTADREGFELPPLRLAVQNQIPVTAGLGSSASATAAGVALAFAVGGHAQRREGIYTSGFVSTNPETRSLSGFVSTNPATLLQYAAAVEGHTDNVAASIFGGLVVTLPLSDGTIVAVHKRWPKMIRVIAVTPELTLETKKSRAVLPGAVPLADATHNLQRSALFVAAIEERRYDLLWDAMQDRLHQPHRQRLIPGLPEVLAMPRMPGLLGIALSGAGPSVIALATDRYDEIGKAIASRFEHHGIVCSIRKLEAAQEGIAVRETRSRK
jgi:homoserine kinase